MSDLSGIFTELPPELRRLIDSPDTPAAPTGLPDDQDDSAVQAYFQRFGGRQPQFLPGQGSTTPPVGGVEGGPPAGAAPPASPAPPAPAPAPAPAPPGPDDLEGEDGEQEDTEPGLIDPTGELPPSDPSVDGVLPPPSTEGFVEIDGQQIPVSQVQAYLQFDQLLQSRPDIARLLSQTINNQFPVASPQQQQQQPYQPQPQPQPPVQLPPDLDLDDPNTRFLVEQLQRVQQQVTALNQGVAQTQTLTHNQLLAQHQQQVLNGAKTFQERMGLDDNSMQRIAVVVQRLNLLPSLNSGIDPASGLPRQIDVPKAVDEAFTAAYYFIPEYRQAEYERQRQNHIQTTRRKQQAGSLAGSSGSVPRTPPPQPTTPDARRAAAVAEVASMLDGTYSQGGND